MGNKIEAVEGMGPIRYWRKVRDLGDIVEELAPILNPGEPLPINGTRAYLFWNGGDGHRGPDFPSFAIIELRVEEDNRKSLEGYYCEKRRFYARRSPIVKSSHGRERIEQSDEERPRRVPEGELDRLISRYKEKRNQSFSPLRR